MSRPADWFRLTLTMAQCARAIEVGRARQEANTAAGVKERLEAAMDPFAANILGALGELAWAIYMGVPWDRAFIDPRHLNRPGQPTWDVCGYHVRATGRQGGRLLLKARDPDAPPYVLAYVTPPVVTFAGWLYGFEAKRVPARVISRARPNMGPVHAAPYQMLRPVATLAPRDAMAFLDLPAAGPATPRTAIEYIDQFDPRDDEEPRHVCRSVPEGGDLDW